jgi:putative transposase
MIAIRPAGRRPSRIAAKAAAGSVWNRIPDEVRRQIVDLALDEPELSPRELAVRFTDTKLLRLGSFGLPPAQGPRPDHQPGLHRHQGGRRVQGQDDGAQPAVADRLHLSQGHRLGLVLSVDRARRLLALHHRLEAVHDDEGRGRHRHAGPGAAASGSTRPRSSPAAAAVDNGSSYIAGDLAEWLDEQGMDHVRGAPNHPQTQGKIERWHQTLKNRILLENYYLPGDLEARSAPSSSTTITGATTRAWATSPRPTSITAEARRS